MRSKKIIAMFLCVAMTVGFTSVTIAASDVSSTNQTLEPFKDVGSSEVLEFRQENVKHFDIGNGMYQAVAYSHPVHKLDDQGNWQDIDFGLTLTRADGTAKYVNADAGTAFAEKYSANQPLVTLSNNDTAMSVSLLTGSFNHAARQSTNVPVAAAITNPQNSFKTFEDAQNATFSSKVLYKEVLPGIDLEYVADPEVVKENIIIREKMPSYEFDFSLQLTGLYPLMKDDGSIILYDLDTHMPQYEIPAPFMYDALGNVSWDVCYTLKGSGNTFTLSVTADDQWINAPDRTFPITVDPTYVVSSTSAEDTFIYSGESTYNYGSSSELWISPDCITYFKTDVPLIPLDMKVLWANFTAFYYYHDYVSSGSVGITAHQVVDFWEEDSFTWNWATQMWTPFGLEDETLDTQTAYANVGATVNNPRQIDFDITDVFRTWTGLVYSNHGIALKYVVNSPNVSVLLKSSESSYDYRPRLTYQYGTGIYEVTHYYDSTMTAANLQKISYIMEIADREFYEMFGIRLYSNGTYIQRQDLTEACEESVDRPCVGDCGLPHHKDVVNIAQVLSNGVDLRNERVVFWTDRPPETYCEHNNIPEGNQPIMLYHYLVDDSTKPVNGFAFESMPSIHILNITPDNGLYGQDMACMAIVFMHELAHTLGLDERYYSYNHTESGFQCVMEEYQDDAWPDAFYEDICDQNVDAFCGGCKNDLLDILYP